MIDSMRIQQFHSRGYTVVPGLFADEAADFRQHFMDMRRAGSYPGDMVSTNDVDGSDPLKQYPRMINMHRWDDLSLNWLLDERVAAWLKALLNSEPYAVQTMVYFKPAGARGQALHQDQFYVRVQPGTCIAAWLALDRCDEENGCMQLVPGTQDLPVLCGVEADLEVSFTGDTVELPEGMEPEPVIMQPGDVLFFNGQVIHGSFPNTSKDRFRRSLIGHYIAGEAQKVAQWFNPVMRLDGTTLDLETNEWGGPCGVWVNRDGTPVVEMAGVEPARMVTRAKTGSDEA